jgi:hypothetical protein
MRAEFKVYNLKQIAHFSIGFSGLDGNPVLGLGGQIYTRLLLV